MKRTNFLTVLLYIIFICSSATAATLDNKGTEFWLAFPKNISNPSYLQLYITGDTTTSGTVSVASESFSENFTVTPGEVTTVEVPVSTMITSNQTVEDKGIHVTSQEEVIIYGINRAGATTDAYMGLPVDVLGNEYLALSYANNISDSNFTILGTEDGTSVTISPSAASGLSSDISFTLNQGEIYNLSRTGADEDVTGSVITSDKPIAVYGGSQCITIPQDIGACDHIVEQLPPTSTWGKNFVTVPLAVRINGDTFRILASADNTTLQIDGTSVATLARGEYYETILDASSYIEADKPVLTAQYSHGVSYDNTTGDPFMMLIPPYEQFLNRYTVTTPAEGFDVNYANLVVPSSIKSNVTFDDGTVPESSFTQIGDTDFYGAQVSV
ncbi:Ig-like domain-containing protein [Denitrovibrio acetiphilus DSM 12809]|uniref:Ig-like domain-containing protein n=1 Tax=Denitrovibrio acetiphilus (strain DSM 12809 / NBRC 114555 / N2460) TaxID=522772 RepID=D4H2G0_DENA2|nr:IgGFc-binding protein [Denitrovibrio acetiphilus]ADD68951.1 Ig-like domain-containing protein [Denitrovibrio acetiphilus DSM 12809]